MTKACKLSSILISEIFSGCCLTSKETKSKLLNTRMKKPLCAANQEYILYDRGGGVGNGILLIYNDLRQNFYEDWCIMLTLFVPYYTTNCRTTHFVYYVCSRGIRGAICCHSRILFLSTYTLSQNSKSEQQERDKGCKVPCCVSMQMC